MRGDPNSKRGQVRTAFKSGGEEAALAVGKSLGIPDAKVRRWINKFGSPTRSTAGKQRVYAKYDPEVLGTVKTEGPEVWEVEWDDGTTATRFISKEKLRDATTHKRVY